MIERTLREISGHSLRSALDQETALAALASDSPEIVFAHLREGAVASTSFLNEVWTRNPQTTRFLLGDSTADSDTLVRCALGPHQYIPAPLDAHKVETALKRAEAIKRFLRDEKIRLLMAKMRTLPSRPTLSIEVRSSSEVARNRPRTVVARAGRGFAAKARGGRAPPSMHRLQRPADHVDAMVLSINLRSRSTRRARTSGSRPRTRRACPRSSAGRRAERPCPPVWCGGS